MLKEKLGHHPVELQVPIGAEDKFEGIIDAVTQRAYFFDGEHGEIIREVDVPAAFVEKTKAARQEIVQRVADVDDVLAEKFLADEPVTTEELRAAIRRATIALKMTPVMCGSAYRNKGVQLLLDAVTYYLPNPTEVVNEAHDQANNEAKITLESDLREAVRGAGVQAPAGPLRPADLLPHLPGQVLGRRHHRQLLEPGPQGARLADVPHALR